MHYTALTVLPSVVNSPSVRESRLTREKRDWIGLTVPMHSDSLSPSGCVSVGREGGCVQGGCVYCWAPFGFISGLLKGFAELRKH